MGPGPILFGATPLANIVVADPKTWHIVTVNATCSLVKVPEKDVSIWSTLTGVQLLTKQDHSETHTLNRIKDSKPEPHGSGSQGT